MQVNTSSLFNVSVTQNLSKTDRAELTNQELVAQNYFYWNKVESLLGLSLSPPNLLKPQNSYWEIVWRRFGNLLFALQKLDKLRRSQKKDFPKMGIIFVNPGEVKA